MIKLQSKDQIDKVAYLDPLTGEVQVAREQKSNGYIGNIQGTFSEARGHTLYMYRSAEVLCLRVDDQTIELTEETEVNLVKVNSQVNRLEVIRQGAKQLSFTYLRPDPNPPLFIDPTPFVDEQDYDFALFIFNIARNPEKKAAIYR